MFQSASPTVIRVLRWTALTAMAGVCVARPAPAWAVVEAEARTAAEAKAPTAAKPAPTETSAKPEPSPLEKMVELYQDAVVYITTLDALGDTTGVGSGCVISADGLVATNYHVMSEAATAYVQLRGGARLDVAGFRAVDGQRDLVILQLKNPPKIEHPFALRAPDAVRPGRQVITIGHPANFRFTVTTGIVSAERTTDELVKEGWQDLQAFPKTNWIQHTAAISNGSSGGPLLDYQGNLLGLNTWFVPQQSIGFAVRVQHLLDLQKKLSPAVQPLPLPGTNVVIEPRVAMLVRDFQREYQQMVRDLSATSREELAETIREQHPTPRYLEKLLELAKQNPGQPVAFEALLTACRLPQDRLPMMNEPFQKVLAELQEKYRKDPRLEQVCLAMGKMSPTCEPFLREVIRNGPSDTVRGTAAFVLMQVFLAAMTRDGASYSAEMVELCQWILDHVASVKVQGQAEPLGELVRPWQFRFQHLTIGRKMPNIQGADFDGKQFQLRDSLGKTVVLDFWADWCPHCRNMYAHERKLVEKFKDRPFVLLGVNCEDPAAGRAAITKGDVTWRSWADGQGGSIAKQWQVETYPTIYVLDRRGFLRYQDVRGQELEEAIHHLLDESKLDAPQDLVAWGARWKYLDDGSDQGTRWRAADFADSAWAEGPAPLGYGLDAEATRVGFGKEADRKHLTTYFRTTFDVAELPRTDRLLLQLSAEDGAVVYLNGHQVARTNMKGNVTPSTPATVDSARPWWNVVNCDVDPSLLRAGRNVLAAEVHLRRRSDAGLHFACALSSRPPALKSAASSASAMVRFGVARLLGAAGVASPEALELLQGLAKDSSSLVKAQAIVGLWQIDSSWIDKLKLPETPAGQMLALRASMGEALNYDAWRIAEVADLDLWQYQRAVRLGRAARAILPKAGHIANTVGAAEYRAGLYPDALKSIGRSMELRGPNPLDLCLEAMVHHRRNKPADAKLALAKARSLLKESKWSNDDEGKQALAEAEKVLATPAPAKH